MQKVNLLIVDDYALSREGIHSWLKRKNSYFDFRIEEAETGEDGVAKIKESHYDIVLMDYWLPGMMGDNAAKAIIAHRPDIKVIVISGCDETPIVNSFLQAGVHGYILKNLFHDELIKAIKTVLNGKNYYSSEIAEILIDKDNQTTFPAKPTEREMGILRLIAKGKTSMEIADQLCISKDLVDKDRRQLLKKMKVSNTIGLLMEARKKKLID